MLRKIFLVSFFLIACTSFASASESDPFVWEVDLSERHVQPGEEIPLEVFFEIPRRHFLYKDKLNLEIVKGEGFKLGSLELSPSYSKKDPFSGKVLEVFESMALLKTKLKTPKDLKEGEYPLKMRLSYQGCSSSLCFRQMKKEITLPIQIQIFSVKKFSFPPLEKGFWLALLLTFLAGLGSDFTPCVLPIIPITLAFFGIRKQGGKGYNFILSLAFLLSMSLTYAVLGVFAAWVGKGLGFLFQNSFFLSFVVLLYLGLSLSLFGLFELQLPLSLRNTLARFGGQGIFGAFLAGTTTGLLAAPCVGPLIASLLLYVAEQRDLLKGTTLLFSYGLGMGSLFFFMGIFYQRFSKISAGPYTVWIKRVFAILLLIPALYYATIVYNLWSYSKKSSAEINQKTSFWLTEPEQAFTKAQAESKTLFVDFYATWCLPCLEMEKKAFSDPRIIDLLQTHFVPLKIDCTQETPSCESMVEKYSIVGWPTLLILKPDGTLLQSFVGKTFSAMELEGILKEYIK